MLRRVENKSLKRPRGRHRGQQGARLRADAGPAMRHVAWCEKRLARAQAKLLVTDLESKLSRDDVKPFVLRKMHVTGRSTFADAVMLEHKQLSTGVVARELDRKREQPPDHHLVFVKPVVARRHMNSLLHKRSFLIQWFFRPPNFV